MAVLGLRFCARAFSSCGKWGPLFIAVPGRASHYCGLSRCGAQAPDAQAQQLWFTGLVAPWHVGSSQTRTRTRVPCIGRQILNHCATREALTNVNLLMSRLPGLCRKSPYLSWLLPHLFGAVPPSDLRVCLQGLKFSENPPNKT